MRDAEQKIHDMCRVFGQPVRYYANLPEEKERTLRKLLLIE